MTSKRFTCAGLLVLVCLIFTATFSVFAADLSYAQGLSPRRRPRLPPPKRHLRLHPRATPRRRRNAHPVRATRLLSRSS
jgi:hypothetical protein